ncbi:MAG: choline dehydrogenase [Xanthomonadales bacterium]|nr:choline dehydrogenase [Xanthomonadales bacterium]
MYDYIIVGAGSAGCVLANRLSADPDARVLLLEAGPRDWHPFIHMPAGIAKLVNRKGVNWDYNTDAEPNLANRQLWWPRGKVLGGSSSINAMCYVRGNRRDYDEWAAQGAHGWRWDDCLPWFRQSENNPRGSSEFHGADGPLGVSDLRHHNPLSDVFLQATREAGFPQNDDFNGARQAGFGYYQVTQKDGARCSSAVAYLDPVRERKNLTILTGALVTKLKIENGRVTAVHYRHNGKPCCEGVEREVLLAGGALNSPQMLMLSGIGPADHLREHGLDVVADLPGVGANLQDHLDVCTLQRCTQNITYDRVSDVAVALNYYLFRRGPGTSNIAETGGFLRSRLAEDERPDLQFHFVPALLDDHGRQRMKGNGYTLHACQLRPYSRGRLYLKSAAPDQKIGIHANYLSDAQGRDLERLLEAVRISRDILAQPAFAPYRGEEIFPGDALTTREQLIDFIRRKAETIYHPVGTCRMGSDASAVVDPQLRVRGVDGLRVVDASVMPKLIGGNTNAPTIMIAERAAAMIRGELSLGVTEPAAAEAA